MMKTSGARSRACARPHIKTLSETWGGVLWPPMVSLNRTCCIWTAARLTAYDRAPPAISESQRLREPRASVDYPRLSDRLFYVQEVMSLRPDHYLLPRLWWPPTIRRSAVWPRPRPGWRLSGAVKTNGVVSHGDIKTKGELRRADEDSTQQQNRRRH